MKRVAALGLVLLACGAAAQSVSLQGMLGETKAVLVIDGAPHTLGVGDSAKGVTLKSLRAGQAEVLAGGRTQVLVLGGAQVSVGKGAGVGPGGTEIVISVGLGGHFITGGAINGKPVQFMVDTGATTIALSQSLADRIGLDWKRGQRGIGQTAGGDVPVFTVNLTRVRVGEVEVHNVAAMVLPAEMPHVLLGNSFLSRFQMTRENDVMTLVRRY
jgi:aspartyl protease family protein